MKFWSGFATGVAAAMALLHALFSVFVTPSVRSTVAGFQGELPAVTRFATSAVWAWAVPVVIVASALGAGLGLARVERVRLAACVGVAVAAVGAFAFTYWASYFPLWQVAGNIRAD